MSCNSRPNRVVKSPAKIGANVTPRPCVLQDNYLYNSACMPNHPNKQPKPQTNLAAFLFHLKPAYSETRII